jgi:hypothetical protein
MNEQYAYLFVRTDISTEQQIVQAGHACMKAGRYFGNQDDHENIVLLGATDGTHIKQLSDWLSDRSIEHTVFFEPDIDDVTAICTRPIEDRKTRNMFRKFRLLNHR